MTHSFAASVSSSSLIQFRYSASESRRTFNDSFFTQDLRLSRTFLVRSERVRLNLFGEVFNLFNTANLIGHSGNLSDPASFGQPAARFSQVFGSGGPRAFQFDARINF